MPQGLNSDFLDWDYDPRKPRFVGKADEEEYDREHPKRYLSVSSEARKRMPVCTGVLDYFPDAIAAVSEVSFLGNEKHNPGEPLHWARGKSMDHADCIARHLIERDGFDGSIRHSAALAWRALALLQEQLEAEKGLSRPRGATEEEEIWPGKGDGWPKPPAILRVPLKENPSLKGSGASSALPWESAGTPLADRDKKLSDGLLGPAKSTLLQNWPADPAEAPQPAVHHPESGLMFADCR